LPKKNAGQGVEMAGAPIPDFELPYTTYGLGGQNGRVNFTKTPGAGGLSVPDSAGFAHPTKTEATFYGDMLRGNWESTELSKHFFTASNVTFLQDAIRKGVYEKSGSKRYIIDDQDVDELKMIMRGIYLQYAKNNPFDILGQIKELNTLIIDWCVPRIMSEIDHYNYYLNDISHLPVPLMQPVSMSSAGTKSLPYQPFM
jgi:hypothetical protein